MLENLKKSDFRIFDQGGINKQNNPGGYHFKSGMGGVETDFIGMYEYSTKSLQKHFIMGAEALVRWSRNMKLWLNRAGKKLGRKGNDMKKAK
jgi:lipid II:glycine glycyltransferase (peptidoglycan interpeptide bridge formation enzyme)